MLFLVKEKKSSYKVIPIIKMHIIAIIYQFYQNQLQLNILRLLPINNIKLKQRLI